MTSDEEGLIDILNKYEEKDEKEKVVSMLELLAAGNGFKKGEKQTL